MNGSAEVVLAIGWEVLLFCFVLLIIFHDIDTKVVPAPLRAAARLKKSSGRKAYFTPTPRASIAPRLY